MATTITMQKMRYINLLSKISRVSTNKCFLYNNTIIFAVPRSMMSQAIGASAKNIKSMQTVFDKKVKIVVQPNNSRDAEIFVRAIVDPVQFKSLEEKDDSFILNAGSQSKAALIGRNRRRLLELNQIMEDCFGKGLRII